MPKSKSKSKSRSRSRSRTRSKSPSKSGSKKSKESVEPDHVMPYSPRKSKGTGTFEIFKDDEIDSFRCVYCKLVFPNLVLFTQHNCWRNIYDSKASLINDRVLVCRQCHTVIYKSEYSIHECTQLLLCSNKNSLRSPEEVIHIDSNFHLDFYINWAKRKDLEVLREDYNSSWTYEQRCSNCGNEFKTKFNYLLHSCILLSKLSAEDIRQLKTCLFCKFVFRNSKVYDAHLKQCNIKPFMVNFTLDIGELILLQIIQTRQTFDLDQHLSLTSSSIESLKEGEPFCMHPRMRPSIGDQTISAHMKSTCKKCRIKYESLEDFLLHPCVAGELITPLHLESVMYCDRCFSLFILNESLIEHFATCQPQSMTFIRLNSPKLIKYALKRWTVDLFENPYLPARPVRFECCDCSEVFRHFSLILNHPCPMWNETYNRGFLHPYNIMETFSCQACHRVFFTTQKSCEHMKCCPMHRDPIMIQIHYDLEEILISLDCWMRCTQLLSLEVALDERNVKEDRSNKPLNCYSLTKIKNTTTNKGSGEGRMKKSKKCLNEETYSLLDCNEEYKLLKKTSKLKI